ncbi:MAG: hypothetical protein E7371_06825 [Clostridiales bacterium]|nr:hypothetical protein [Clostridiales bacterium]
MEKLDGEKRQNRKWSFEMAQQKKGFITRMLEGKEKSEEYARSTLPTTVGSSFGIYSKGILAKYSR